MILPSQSISAENIDSKYDKLHAEHELLKSKLNTLIDKLQDITVDNTNFGTYNYVQKLCEEAKK